MHLAHVAGLLLSSIATLAQQQSVEITSEPSHHLVLENAYVRVFDVTVAPKATTLVHRHHNDYLFVTLGDSDVISARPGEKPAALLLKDGEIRFTPGKFEHAAINQSDKPFHNITIELLKPATHVTTCNGDCAQEGCIGAMASSKPVCPSVDRRITSNEWKMSLWRLEPSTQVQTESPGSNTLLIAVSDINIEQQLDGETKNLKLAPGGLAWIPASHLQILKNGNAGTARYVVLEFNPEKQ
jgi:quercetin dioxygenase-like cupin family protein